MARERTLKDINNLLKQLPPEVKKISPRQLARVIKHGDFFWAVNVDTMNIVGIVTLTHVYKPTAFFGIMEDLVVDEKWRKHGIGTRLIEKLRQRATKLGMSYVEFTSRSSRIEANRKYLQMDAQPKKTNVYRFIM